MIFSLLTLGVKALGALREAFSVAIFGLGDELDAFYVAFTIASFVIIVVGSSFQTAYIPIYLESKREGNKAHVQSIFSQTLTTCLLVLITVTALLGIALPYLLPLIISGFNPQKLKLTLGLVYELTPLMILGGLSLTLTAVLNAEEEFKATALIPGLTSITLIVALLILAKTLGIQTISVGLILGAILELLFLLRFLQRKGLKIKFEIGGQNPKVKQVIKNALPIAGAIAISGLMPIVDQSFAAHLKTGDIAALGLGNRVISLALTLFATAVATVVFPYFSKLALEKDWANLRRVFYANIYKFILPVTVLSTLAIALFSDLIVRLVFQRGAFTAQNTELVSAIQIIYALQIPAYVIYQVGFRLLNAIYSNSLITIISLISLINNIWLNYYLARAMGVKGIALSTSLVYIIAMIFTLVVIKIEIKRREKTVE